MWKKRGFTLIEWMTITIIVSILLSMSIPTYTSFKKRSRVKAAIFDITSLSKGWLGFGMYSNNFCQDSSGVGLSIERIGFGHLLRSKNYGTDNARSPSFIGFGDTESSCIIHDPLLNVVSASDLYVANVSDPGSANAIGIGANQHGAEHRSLNCKLDRREFKIGILRYVSPKEVKPINMDHEGILTEYDVRVFEPTIPDPCS